MASWPAAGDGSCRSSIELARRSTPSLRKVINATGIVLHTGLGRAPLCESAIEAIADAASGYSNLEFDLATGERGRRSSHVRDLLISLTGAEAATVVNNNAAATLLILQTLAAGREVLVSRGQLIEIGGSFRLPDIMRAGSVTLREVGTTNRTRISDYEKAANDQTAMLMRVHTSNYRIVGFTEEVAIAELAALAHRLGLIALDDLGSGALFDPASFGLPDEPDVRTSIAAGADLVCFSGDKLLGGPQCGIILGKKSLIGRIESNPLMRTYRVGKLTLLALEATLRHYADIDDAMANVPALSMLQAPTEELAARADHVLQRLSKELPGEQFFIGSDVSYAGGGAMPAAEVPTVIVRWHPSFASTAQTIAALRAGEPPVVARIREDAVCFDLRTVCGHDLGLLVDAIIHTASDHSHDDDDEEHHCCDGHSLPVL
ncbi:MAG: L-seryl-tRNA(Sec) selenium transferase, partial [Planctomycetes bacterium]|nr:L-seryl-tRNA(Sec) selenium transferase [Planctomycetota bacterium]